MYNYVDIAWHEANRISIQRGTCYHGNRKLSLPSPGDVLSVIIYIKTTSFFSVVITGSSTGYTKGHFSLFNWSAAAFVLSDTYFIYMGFFWNWIVFVSNKKNQKNQIWKKKKQKKTYWKKKKTKKKHEGQTPPPPGVLCLPENRWIIKNTKYFTFLELL